MPLRFLERSKGDVVVAVVTVLHAGTVALIAPASCRNDESISSPRDLRTHILRLWGPKTILYKAFGLF